MSHEFYSSHARSCSDEYCYCCCEFLAIAYELWYAATKPFIRYMYVLCFSFFSSSFFYSICRFSFFFFFFLYTILVCLTISCRPLFVSLSLFFFCVCVCVSIFLSKKWRRKISNHKKSFNNFFFAFFLLPLSLYFNNQNEKRRELFCLSWVFFSKWW